MPQVSIIVPIFNAAPYLADCLRSIENQFFRDFECLLIDDGSYDDSVVICERFVAKDSRFKLFQQQHQGISKTRSFGLSHAQGDYICWADADDEIYPNYILDLLTDIVEGHCDLVIHGYWKQCDCSIDNLRQIPPSKAYSRYVIPCEIDRFFEETTLYRFGYSFSKIFSRQIIQNFCLTYNQNITLAEDLDFLLRYLIHCRKVLVNTKCNYLYKCLPNSLSHVQHPLFQEMSGLKCIDDSWNRLSTVFSNTMTSNVQKQQYLCVSEYVHRVIVSCFHAGLSRKERILQFQSLPERYVQIYGQYHKPTPYLSIISYLFLHHHFLIADLFLSIRI